jgi:hypothetical protein
MDHYIKMLDGREWTTTQRCWMAENGSLHKDAGWQRMDHYIKMLDGRDLTTT